jgi:WD40 repeat protein
MKMSRLLLIACLFGAMISGLGCTPGGEMVQTPTGVTAATPSPIQTTASPIVVTPSSTPLPPVTLTPVPTVLPSPSSTAPLPTEAPFLPSGLVPISPQNAANLKALAVLSEQGAGVVACSPDSQRMAAGLFRSNQIKIWDLVNGQELFSLGGHVDPRIISYLAFSPDGSQLASGAQGWDAQNDSLILWDAAKGRELDRFNPVLGAISPDWRLAGLTQREQDQGSVLVLSAWASGDVLHVLQAPGDIYGVAFSPDGQHVAAKMYNVFQDLFAFWSTDSGRLERTLYDWLEFSYSPDGRFIAALVDSGSGSDQGDVSVFDGKSFNWIKTPAKGADSLWFTSPAFSPDGQILAASFGNQVTLWDTQSWQALASLPVSGRSGITFSPDGRLLTTYGQSGAVQLWGVTRAQ